MRLFIGVELSDDVKASAARVAEQVRERLARERVHLDARWVPWQNLHITLWFIGEVNDDRADAIRTAFARPFDTRVFDLALGGCGAFPPSGPPRVLWIGVREGSEGLRRVYDEVAARLLPLGYRPERRPYSAHLTVARVKDVPRASAASVRRALENAPGDTATCRIESVTVFRSHLSPKGSQYEPLMRVPLQP